MLLVQERSSTFGAVVAAIHMINILLSCVFIGGIDAPCAYLGLGREEDDK